jgi:AmmeMemoRadiSam system protein B
MQIREYSLPAGWYPRDPDDVSKTINRYLTGFTPVPSRAAISPHAGWYYSGRIAALGTASLDSQAQTIVVIGGHLSASSAPVFAMEDAVRTPFGHLSIDKQLRAALMKELNGKEDHFKDNTVEVLLPMVHFFFPKANLLWLRLPANIASFNAGKIISAAAAKLNRKVNVLASNDLTHYGSNYGFTSQGTGLSALRWVQEVNDAAFIHAVETGDKTGVLRCAEKDFASCSAGAVLGVMGFAKAEGLGNARLLEYGTSADLDKGKVPDSFVGYAAMVFG